MRILKSRIIETLQGLPRRVLTHSDMVAVIQENHDRWRLADDVSDKAAQRALQSGDAWDVKSLKPTLLLPELVEQSLIRKVDLPFPSHAVTRYTIGEAPTLELIQSIDQQAFFSHYTALQLHGLTQQIPKTIYVNVEQGASSGGGQLSQAGINRAFKGKCRVSNNTITFRDRTVCRLNGANTGQLGVIPFESDESESPLRVTNVERSLIDATVRTVYAGGVSEVARAFEVAADDVSVNKMASYLRKMNFTYPYHQSIGYYMERTGRYKKTQLDLMRSFDMEFDFYLTYNMGHASYNEKWRLFIPEGF